MKYLLVITLLLSTAISFSQSVDGPTPQSRDIHTLEELNELLKYPFGEDSRIVKVEILRRSGNGQLLNVLINRYDDPAEQQKLLEVFNTARPGDQVWVDNLRIELADGSIRSAYIDIDIIVDDKGAFIINKK